jgi:hypothetical protein
MHDSEACSPAVPGLKNSGTNEAVTVMKRLAASFGRGGYSDVGGTRYGVHLAARGEIIVPGGEKGAETP